MSEPITTPPAPDNAGAPKPRRGRLLLALTALMAVSGLIALLLAELAVRLAAPQQLIQIRSDLWMPADSIGWQLRPNASARINTGERAVTVYTDREGFRVGTAGREEAPTRVLFIGDSFTEAIQVEHEQSFAALVQADLARRLGRPVVVRNAGVSDWSPNHYLIRGRSLMDRDSFDLLVVNVFAGNDAVGSRVDYIPPRAPVERNHFRLPRGLTKSELVNAFLAPVNDALEQRSHLFVLLKNQFAVLRMRLGVTADYFPSEFRKSEAASERWGVASGLVGDLGREARRRGVPVLVALIPERIQVSQSDFDRYLKGFGIDPDTVDLDQPTRLLLDGIRAESLTVIDALPAFREAAPTSAPLYGRVDQHLTPAGHQLLADLIAPEAARILATRR